jgi:hypothetical protein
MKAWRQNEDGTWEGMSLPERLQSDSALERHCARVGWVASETEPGSTPPEEAMPEPAAATTVNKAKAAK